MPNTRSTYRQKDGPIDSSTPGCNRITAGIRGRRSIQDQQSPISMPSPILARNLEDSDSDDQRSDATESSASDTEELDEPTPVTSTLTHEAIDTPHEPSSIISKSSTLNWFIIVVSICVGIVTVGTGFKYFFSDSDNKQITNVTLEEIQSRFPLQSPELWYAFKSGIEEVETFNKPSVFLLLYEGQSHDKVHQLVGNISQYCMCKINGNCSETAVTLSHDILNSKKVLSDYGNLIADYKNDLENKGVMIVYNIEEIKGHVAQAFHVICDEITPLVNKALLIFTMKVDNFPNGKRQDMKLIENVLYNKWSDLNRDIFYPLFTRITSMVLRVSPDVKEDL